MVTIVVEDTDFKNNHFRNWDNVFSSEPSVQGLTRVLESLEGREKKVVITWASTSFLDYNLVDRLASRGEYDIMFIPNLPDYMEFEIWDISFLLEKLRTFPSVKKPLRNSMSSLELDESLFFVDIYQPDIRLYRFDLVPNAYKSKKVVEYLYGCIDFSKELAPQILEVLKNNPEILTKIPTFYMFEVSNKILEDTQLNRSWNVSFGNLSSDVFFKVFEKVRELSREFVCVFGVYNEPLFADEIRKIFDFITSQNLEGITFILSTSLPQVDDFLLDFYKKTMSISGYRGYDKFYIYVNLPKLGSNRFNEVITNAGKLREIDPKRVYIRFVRDKESVKYLPKFYSDMKEYNVVISRTFDIKLMDADTVFPVRVPCYKLQTSLVVLPNGDVPLCLNDLSLSNKLGNVLDDDIAEIALRKAKYYKHHFLGNYEGTCKDCIIWDQYDL
jgi:spiro-SPASM protein